MNKLSADFHRVLDNRPIDTNSQAYRNALFHLLVAETSCFRYWGQGIWTDYAREFCRRGSDILAYRLPLGEASGGLPKQCEVANGLTAADFAGTEKSPGSRDGVSHD